MTEGETNRKYYEPRPPQIGCGLRGDSKALSRLIGRELRRREKTDIIRSYRKTGWPSKLKWPRTISALTRSDRIFRFKIGVSASPDTRVNGYGGYDDMVIVYSSRLRKNALTVEKRLTELYKDYCDNCDNKNNGGGGRDSRKPEHYVYIVRRFV